jgi:CheY-like chemotaxis protein
MVQKCILQVEDEETDVLLLRHAFKKADIANPLFVASDGAEAISYLSGEGRFANRAEYPLPSLVLLDLKLPDKPGLAVLEWMRSQTHLKTIVVVAFTSSDYEGDIKRAYELGVNSYAVKPSDNDKRVQFALRLRDWWLSCNRFAFP